MENQPMDNRPAPEASPPAPSITTDEFALLLVGAATLLDHAEGKPCTHPNEARAIAKMIGQINKRFELDRRNQPPAQAPAPGRETCKCGHSKADHESVNGCVYGLLAHFQPVNPCPCVKYEAGTEGGPEAPETARQLRGIAHLVGSIYFYGGFKAETYNERLLEEMLVAAGFRYRSEDEVISGFRALEAAPASVSPTESETGADPK